MVQNIKHQLGYDTDAEPTLGYERNINYIIGYETEHQL